MTILSNSRWCNLRSKVGCLFRNKQVVREVIESPRDLPHTPSSARISKVRVRFIVEHRFNRLELYSRFAGAPSPEQTQERLSSTHETCQIHPHQLGYPRTPRVSPVVKPLFDPLFTGCYPIMYNGLSTAPPFRNKLCCCRHGATPMCGPFLTVVLAYTIKL